MFLKILQKPQETPAPESCFNKVAGLWPAFLLIKKEIPGQVLSCQFCEIFKNTFSIEHLGATASGLNVLAKT